MPGPLKLGHSGHGCLMFPFEKGECGAAACYFQTQIVDDVSQFDGHIACSASTQFELVIPVFDQYDSLLAVLEMILTSANFSPDNMSRNLKIF